MYTYILHGRGRPVINFPHYWIKCSLYYFSVCCKPFYNAYLKTIYWSDTELINLHFLMGHPMSWLLVVTDHLVRMLHSALNFLSFMWFISQVCTHTTTCVKGLSRWRVQKGRRCLQATTTNRFPRCRNASITYIWHEGLLHACAHQT